MTGWKRYRVRDVATTYDGPHATPKSTKTATDGAVFLGISSLEAGRIDLSQSAFLDEDDFVTWTRRVTPRAGDVVFSYETRLGQAAIIPDGLRCALGRRLALMRPNAEVVDARFLLYTFLGPRFQEVIRENTVPGSTVPRILLTEFPEFPIDLPDLTEQRAIAATLGSIDEKIDSRRRSARLTEELLQAEFRSWFIEYQHWGGEQPAGWREARLGDVLESIKRPTRPGVNLDMPYVPIDTIPMRSLGLNDYRPNEDAQSSLITFEPDDILIGAMRVYFHRVSIAPFAGITRSTCFVLRPRDRAYLQYALLLCNEDSTIDYASSTSKGSTMPYAVWDGGLADMAVIVPPREVAEAFAEVTGPMIQRLRDGLLEARQLRDMRDALLPALLSGKIRAADAVEEVA